jgi:hypothetical protein
MSTGKEKGHVAYYGVIQKASIIVTAQMLL